MIMEQLLVKISVAGEMLGAKPDTLRKRERAGELMSTRYRAVADLLAIKDEGAPNNRLRARIQPRPESRP